tara:strand:- start:270 stop:1049 length:780 start_codon:yes stop_codon:yes gene_type:complete
MTKESEMAKKNGLSELEAALEAGSGEGLEEITTSDLQIPFIRPIQPLSPQVKKSDPAYLEDASPGDIINTVTNQLWIGDEGLVVLPVHYQLKFLEFIPRVKGGGFVRELSADSNDVRTAVRDRDSGMELLENGNELVRTAQHWVKIVHEDGSLESAIVDMKKTQLKRSRQWNTLMMMRKRNGVTLASFSHTYRLKTVEESNDKGSWHSWSIALEGQVPSLEVYVEARELHGSINRGELQLAPPAPEAVADQILDDDVPF